MEYFLNIFIRNPTWPNLRSKNSLNDQLMKTCTWLVFYHIVWQLFQFAKKWDKNEVSRWNSLRAMAFQTLRVKTLTRNFTWSYLLTRLSDFRKNWKFSRLGSKILYIPNFNEIWDGRVLICIFFGWVDTEWPNNLLHRIYNIMYRCA